MKYLTIFLALFSLINVTAKKYNIAPLIDSHVVEKQIVVCVPSYNNEKFYKENLDSICKQKYTNFKVLYVDDASKDNTKFLVSEYIRENALENKIKLICNNQNKGALHNVYDMIHSCEDDAIIVCVDGDDWLKHDLVLKRINSAYLDENVWVTYGQYMCFPELWGGHCRKMSFEELKEKKHREGDFIWSHVRTFYAGLFKKIPKNSLQNQEGSFFPISCDVAIMLNLIDMAPSHIFFIPDILYVYNRENPLSDFRMDLQKQKDTEEYIKKMPPLMEVSTWR
jgi:glycosyltransferase involved in cell wall biosynthesis